MKYTKKGPFNERAFLIVLLSNRLFCPLYYCHNFGRCSVIVTLVRMACAMAFLYAVGVVEERVERQKILVFGHKKSPFDTVCHRGFSVGATGLEPVTPCL